MFEGFERHRVRVGDVTIQCVRGGSGPPVLLLHGYPQTHAMWHQVAPTLAKHYTVVAADLRGYGDSTAPPDPEDADDHTGYSFRAMAADQVAVMAGFGFDRFTVIGHDRGGRVAHRMALDTPQVLDRVACLDILPTRYVLAHVDWELASRYYHWFFLSQPADLPERLIGGDRLLYLHRALSGLGAGAAFDSEAMAEYERCFDATTVHTVCEDYRAALTVDQNYDEADRDRRISLPLLLLWGTRGVLGRDDPLRVWREYATDVRGTGLNAGHFLVEQRPQETLRELLEFLG